MAFVAKTERLISLKKLSGKAHTSNEKVLYNEELPSGISISTKTIFASDISTSPSSSYPFKVTGNVEFLRFPITFIDGADTTAGRHGFEIKLPSNYESESDNSKAGTYPYLNNQVINITSGSLQMIPPSFAPGYEAKPYYGTFGTGSLIAVADTRAWNLDYFNGILFQQTPPGTGDHSQNPSYVEGYLYIGDYLSETSGGGSGDITAVVAGTGLTGGANSGSATVNLDINSLTADSNSGDLSDSVAIVDASDGNASKKITLNQLRTLIDSGTKDFSAVSVDSLSIGTSSAAGTISIDADPTLAAVLGSSGCTITLNDGLGNDFSEVILEFLNHDTSPGVVTTKPNTVPMNVKATSSTPLNSRIIFNIHPDHADNDTLSDNKWHTHWSTSGTEPVRIRLFDQDGNHLYFIPVQGNVHGSGNFQATGASNVVTNSFGQVRFDDVLDNGDGSKSSYYSVGIVNSMGDNGEKLMYNMAVAILDAINRGNINFQAVHIISDGGSSSSDLGALSNSNYLGNGIGSGLYAWMAVDALMIVSNDAESTGHPIGIKMHRPAGKTWSNLSAPPIKIFYDLHSSFDVSSSSEFSAPTNTDVFYTQRAVYGKEQESDSSLDNTEYAAVLARVINNLPIQITATASETSVSLSTNQGNASVSSSCSSNFGITNFDGGGSVSITDGSIIVSTGTGESSKLELYCENNQHKVTVKSPNHSQFSGNVNFTLPYSNGTSGQVLVTDGSGNTSWSTVSGGGGSSGSGGGREKDIYELSDTNRLTNISISQSDVSTVSYNPESIDVFLNGMLMHSGSASEVSNSQADYYFTGPSTLQFSFAVESDDLLDVVVAGGDAPPNAPYITFESHSVLSNERVLRTSEFLSLTTGSAGYIDIDISRKKIMLPITSTLSTGSPLASGYNFSNVNYDPQRIDVFVNGVLMTSGSANDYFIQPTNNVIFTFDLFADDNVIISIV